MGFLDKPLGKGWIVAGAAVVGVILLMRSSTTGGIGNLRGIPRDWADLGGGGSGGIGGLGDMSPVFGALTRTPDVSGVPTAPPGGAQGASPAPATPNVYASPYASQAAALGVRPGSYAPFSGGVGGAAGLPPGASTLVGYIPTAAVPNPYRLPAAAPSKSGRSL